ncbi:MAG TPA: hypothetical protein GX518_01210 [Firmicutes bacterium]|nr:hypothetical protein [Bacillota bacterium]
MTRARTVVTLTLVTLLILTVLAPAKAAAARWVKVGDLPGYPSSEQPAPAPEPSEPEEPAEPEAPQVPEEPKPAPNPQPTPSGKGKWVSVGELMNPPKQEPAPPAAPGDLPPIPSGLTSAEKQFLQYLNQERIAAGLQPLTVDMELVRLARLKAQDITKYNYNGHDSPTYGNPSYMARRAGVKFTRLGETIVKAGDPYKGHKLLMGSAAHRNILLSPNYTRVGIGVDYYNGRHNINGLVGVSLLAD